MNRIGQTFMKLRERKEKALIAYVTAGDPSLDATRDIIGGLAEAGVDILEIGVPFSDPTADGPVIQAASQRALKSGTNLSGILSMIESIRRDSDLPIVLFGYYNPILQYGPERFAEHARAAGVDGILVVDLPPEEYEELRTYTDRAGIDFISLIAPTTPPDRMGQIADEAAGFLYYVSITGVTGTDKPRASDITADMKRVRAVTALPVVVGFGISTPQQAKEIAPYADGIVVGSAFVSLIERHGERDDLVSIVSRLGKEIKQALMTVSSPSE
jgi:tryptophan synthase alpha chain